MLYDNECNTLCKTFYGMERLRLSFFTLSAFGNSKGHGLLWIVLYNRSKAEHKLSFLIYIFFFTCTE